MPLSDELTREIKGVWPRVPWETLEPGVIVETCYSGVSTFVKIIDDPGDDRVWIALLDYPALTRAAYPPRIMTREEWDSWDQGPRYGMARVIAEPVFRAAQKASCGEAPANEAGGEAKE